MEPGRHCIYRNPAGQRVSNEILSERLSPLIHGRLSHPLRPSARSCSDYPDLRACRAARHCILRDRATQRARNGETLRGPAGRRLSYPVAEFDREIVGFAYAGPYRARPAYRWSVEDSIYIAPAMQRRGIGRALLKRLIAEAEAGGSRQMIAVIGDSANTGSIELHRAAGF